MLLFQLQYLLIAHKIHQKLLEKMTLYWSVILGIMNGQVIAGI